MQKKETTKILVSANILPNKVYTNVTGQGFCLLVVVVVVIVFLLVVGNNQSLKVVERTNSIEIQGLNGQYYIN